MLLFLLACTASSSDTAPDESVCNGSAALCGRSLSAVAFAGTHNSMSSEELGWSIPNQSYAVPAQLADGVRALNLDTHAWEDGLWLCHGYCDLGSQPLVEGFAEITDFLTDSPGEVVILTLQDGISGEQTRTALTEAGLADLAYAHTTGQPWPTLGELIDADQRVVIFSGSGGGVDWHHSQWEHWIDVPYSAESVEDFACTDDRGDLDTATLYNINHFLTSPFASPELAEEANTLAVMQGHVADCQAASGRFPNQVLVDFYDIGAVESVVDALNAQ
ncbi:MAG: hypothetical protein ACI8RZ_004389 [Myxococcota bacterium]|jgi:hypothetical protein